ncbi:MAG: DNA recombination protein RmuC [Kiritimatiellae bacterium]|nr:DNA recombination protein RmuC [Kiritimatiellia bacterium]
MEFIPVILICIILILAAIWIRHAFVQATKNPGQDQILSLLQNQIHATTQQTTQQMEQLRQSIQHINTQFSQTMNSTRQAMDHRLEGASHLMQGVHKTLGELGETNKQVLEVGKDIATLQDLLRAPKLRGNFGELFLYELLAQILPGKHYQTQYTFQGGEMVDAVVLLKAGMVPIDAKFPLENFKRITEGSNEDESKIAKKNFQKDVKNHIETIALKYIRCDEGTFDFALMYIPAEHVYYESIIKDEAFGNEMTLFNYALSKRIIPVSPNTLYAYLQTILLGLKGMRIEESARHIMDHLGRIRQEMDRFQNEFRIVGKHLEDSLKKYHDAERRLGRIEDKMEEIEGTSDNDEEKS